MNRRDFAKVAATGAAGLSVSPTILTGTGWKGANDRVNIGVIGIRSMGQSHITGYSASKNGRVSALCDVDSNLFDERIKNLFTDKGLSKPKIYNDLRKLFEDKDIDAVSITTPNHWHALASIWALQAGKHVSVEKPCCHNFFEGRKLVEAAEKYRLIVQDGAEQRSNPCGQSMADYLHSGKLGEVYMAKGLCYKWRDTIGKAPEEPVPAGVDYDLELGFWKR
jgi:predicted dehydrogenase